MASQLATAIRLLGPRIPLMIKTAVLNLLSLSANSSKQNLITEVAVTVLRSIISVSKPLDEVQRFGFRDPGISGPMWIAKATISAPDTEECQELLDLIAGQIRGMGDGNETYTLPTVQEVTGEWNGYRKDVSSHAPRPDLPAESDHYTKLAAETTSPLTILYFHGGAYFMMDPASHRDTTTYLAKLTGGKVFSVRYRLSPQSPFPAQLIDAFISYLYLLSPPKGSFHQPISASTIVFAGDSAGGNLALALTQFLLGLKRSGISSVNFHGQNVTIDLPAGVSSCSPWCDISRSLPSVHDNAQYDYLDPPSATGLPKVKRVPCSIWPTSPPRAELFCEASMMHHPLVSPVTATPKLWDGAPPAFFTVGSEGLEDEICLTAERMYRANVHVSLVGYEGMPHCFAMIFRKTASAKDCFDRWAKFCIAAIEGDVPKVDHGLWMRPFSSPLHFDDISFEKICRVSDQHAEQCFKSVKQRSIEREQQEVKLWREQQSRAKL